jgi:hypothetical protein
LQCGSVSHDETNYIQKRFRNNQIRNAEPESAFKMAVSARRKIERGSSLVDKGEFQNKLKDTNNRSSLAGQGEMILENKLSISKDEQSYFTNPKVFTNSVKMPGGRESEFYSQKPLENVKNLEYTGAEFNRYQYNMPNYFRYMDNPNYRNIKHVNAKGQDMDMMFIVSRNQGWITVEPENLDRKHPLEKKRLGDVSKVSELSPIWMQVDHEKPKSDPLKSIGIEGNSRIKANRTQLVDKVQQNRSIFAVQTANGQAVSTNRDAMHEAIRTVNRTTGKSDLIGWRDSSLTHKYPKEISGKIGSTHFQ